MQSTVLCKFIDFIISFRSSKERRIQIIKYRKYWLWPVLKRPFKVQRILMGGFIIYITVFPYMFSVGRMNKVGWAKWMAAKAL